MPDEELSKRLRLLCGERSERVFARIGSRFSEYNADGLLVQTFAMHGLRVWRAVEAELPKAAPKPRRVDLPVSPREKPLTDEEKARELERLIETWNKACVERGWPTAQWSRDAVDKYSAGRLHRFIEETRLHQIPDQELLIRLGIIVDYAAKTSLVDKLDVSTLRAFVLHGEQLFGSTLDAWRSKASYSGSGNDGSTEDFEKDSLCTDAEVPLPCDSGEA
jgi:hypothetical protein